MIAALVAAGLSAGGAAGAASAAQAASVATGAPLTPLVKKEHRRGGIVHRAWPRKTGTSAPRARIARWLAHQVGPIALDPRHRRRTRAGASRAYAAVAAAPPTTPVPVTVQVSGSPEARLLLIRSFTIPTTSDDYASLSNYSWTYDNALAVMAFIASGDRAQATQLLDQLSALQNADGSLDFAYDVVGGAGSVTVRSGAMAWVGLAAADYRRTYGNARYDPMIGGIVTYLMALRTPAGLIRGGPDVAWVSRRSTTC